MMQSRVKFEWHRLVGALIILVSVAYFFNAKYEFGAQARDLLQEAKPARVMPDFASIQDIPTKKERFFAFMEPAVHEANQHIMDDRRRIESLSEQTHLSVHDQQWLMDIASDYGVTLELHSSSFFPEILRRVDIVPPSIALVQAANESAWGTSRFAREGNNLFGQWCFSKGCGIVPSQRSKGATHEVQRFSDVEESIASYMHNLNTNVHYENLRMVRADMRKNNHPISGMVLVNEMSSYSIRGLAYVRELQQMIQSNRLMDVDLTRYR